jgi:hypothetical protein
VFNNLIFEQFDVLINVIVGVDVALLIRLVVLEFEELFNVTVLALEVECVVLLDINWL